MNRSLAPAAQTPGQRRDLIHRWYLCIPSLELDPHIWIILGWPADDRPRPLSDRHASILSVNSIVPYSTPPWCSMICILQRVSQPQSNLHWLHCRAQTVGRATSYQSVSAPTRREGCHHFDFFPLSDFGGNQREYPSQFTVFHIVFFLRIFLFIIC